MRSPTQHETDMREEGRRPAPRSQHGPPRPEHWDGRDPRQTVETVMMVRLTEELQLNDEQTVVMVRRLRELREDLVALKRERGVHVRALKQALEEQAPDAAISASLDTLLAHDRRLETFKQDKLAMLSEGLTASQRARLYVFLNEFEDDMRQLVNRAQERAKEWRRRDGEWRRPGEGEEEGDAGDYAGPRGRSRRPAGDDTEPPAVD
jgi:hypothetical protein